MTKALFEGILGSKPLGNDKLTACVCSGFVGDDGCTYHIGAVVGKDNVLNYTLRATGRELVYVTWENNSFRITEGHDCSIVSDYECNMINEVLKHFGFSEYIDYCTTIGIVETAGSYILFDADDNIIQQ